MTTIAVIQARMGSTRLPGKILMGLAGKPVLEWVVDAAHYAPGVDEVVVATSTNSADDIVENVCEDWGVRCVRGSERDVISRFVKVAKETNGDYFLRLTGDCPFHDPDVIGAVVALFKSDARLSYASNIDPPTWPDGLDVEIFTNDALMRADLEANRHSDRDCVTRYIARNRSRFSSDTLICPIPGMIKERWVLDTENDLKFCRAIADKLTHIPPSYLDILEILEFEPELRELNSMHPRNERFYEGINNENLGSYSYSRSKEDLLLAKSIIPLGAQTFSKSYVQFPGNSPLFVSHGDGAYVYDVDGNEYVDLVSGLLPVILGYRDPDVDTAIRKQLNSGITFSLSTELERELASRIQKHIHTAEMVRFGKNGSDVTTVSVRLARAHTNRDLVLSSGYHGWGDSFVGDYGDRGRGVPEDVRRLTVHLKHGDSESAIKLLKTEKYACVIVEPETDPEFLQVLRDVCDETGTVLIFDEVITWPRWGMGGAQEYWRVYPDLTCISKAMGNGMPISAICGKRNIMMNMEPPNNIFYSGTFQGETLSLAAAIACIDKLERENVVEKINSYNTNLNGIILALAQRYATPVVCSFTPGLTRLNFEAQGNATKEQIATLFRRVMAANGVLIIASNNLGYMHREQELKRVERAYERAFQTIQEATEKGDISNRIDGVLSASANVRAG